MPMRSGFSLLNNFKYFSDIETLGLTVQNQGLMAGSFQGGRQITQTQRAGLRNPYFIMDLKLP